MTGSTLPKSTSSTIPSPDSDNTAQGNAWTRPYPDTAPHTDRNTHNRFTEDRTEPSWNEPPGPAAKPGIDTMHFAARAPDDERPPARGKGLRVLLMAGIFIVGAGAGLAGAWWFSKPPQLPIVTAVKKAPASPGANLNKPVEPSRSGPAVRGISPSELPYDGASPPVDLADTAPQPKRPVAEAKTVAPPLPPAAAVPAPASSSEPMRTAPASNGALSSGSSTEDEKSPEPAYSQTDQTTLREADKGRTSAKSDAPKPVAKASARPRTVEKGSSRREATAKSAKDREIERIRQQAEEELKRKPVQGRSSRSSPRGGADIAKRQSRRNELNGTKTAESNHVRTALARCERASNFILREQCKWRLCNGAWGKNGCPYYPPHASNIY